jgi:hypothetical protein
MPFGAVDLAVWPARLVAHDNLLAVSAIIRALATLCFLFLGIAVGSSAF